MKIQTFFESVYRPQRLLGKSANTVRLYGISIRKFGRFLATEPTLEHLTNENLIGLMQSQLDSKRSPATANKDRNQLLTLWRHAHRLGMIDRWPIVPELIEPERTPEAWLAEDVAKLLVAIDWQDGFFGPVPRSLWWETLVRLGLDTGERIGALRATQFGWIRGEWINVPAEARKGKRRDRAYRLSHTTLGRLMAIRLVSPESVFPWPYSPNYIWSMFGQLLRDAGLPATKRDKFHRLRRTTASVCHACGIDAQEALDHQYRRTTQKYLDPRFCRDQQVSDVLTTYLESGTSDRKQK